jgi:hypothetical protein
MCDTVHMFSRQVALNVKLGEVNLDYIYILMLIQWPLRLTQCYV